MTRGKNAMTRGKMLFTLTAVMALSLSSSGSAFAVNAADIPTTLTIPRPEPLTALDITKKLKGNQNVLQAVSLLTNIGFSPAEICDAVGRVYHVNMVGAVSLLARAGHTIPDIVASFKRDANVGATVMSALLAGAHRDRKTSLMALAANYVGDPVGRAAIETAVRVATPFRVFEGDVCFARRVLSTEMSLTNPKDQATLATSGKYDSAQLSKRCQ